MQNEYVSFEQFLTVRNGLQAITVLGYCGSVKRMQKVLGLHPTHEELNKYMYALYTSTFSYSHKTNTALALEKWCEFKGYPITFGRQKKPRSIIKDTLVESEITKLFFSTKNIREQAVLSVLAYSGMRNSELCKLKVNDVNLGGNSLTIIRGKGLKDRLVNVSSDCIKTVLDYLTKYPRANDSFLFTTLRKNNQYDPRDLRKFIKVLARRAEINRRVYPHLIRHSLAMNLLNRGADIYLIKSQLGHSLIETTMHYLNSLNYAGKSAYDQHVPSYN